MWRNSSLYLIVLFLRPGPIIYKVLRQQEVLHTVGVGEYRLIAWQDIGGSVGEQLKHFQAPGWPSILVDKMLHMPLHFTGLQAKPIFLILNKFDHQMFLTTKKFWFAKKLNSQKCWSSYFIRTGLQKKMLSLNVLHFFAFLHTCKLEIYHCNPF